MTRSKRKPKKPVAKRKNARAHKAGHKVARTNRQNKREQKPRTVDPARKKEKALSRVKLGATQKAAANAEGVPIKALRKFMKENTRAKWVNGKLEIIDTRPVYTLFFEDGRLQSFPFRKKAASKIGKFWNAVNEALLTNDPSHLLLFRDARVRDAYYKYHIFDTDLNALRRADSIGDLAFHTLYPKTAI